jgi:methionyl aminopeptidase
MTLTGMKQNAEMPTKRRSGQVRLHGPEAFAAMRKAGQLTAQALDLMVGLVKPGVTTEFLDQTIFEFAMDHGAYPAPLYYRGYPRAICTSINHVVCHGIPCDKPLKEGDIVNIDVTLIVDGWHGDSSRMYGVGEVPRRAMRLMEITHECLEKGIAAVKPGATTGHIGEVIQRHAEAERCSVVRDFCGHGLGELFHDDPNILHYGRAGEGVEMKPGMFFTIEPMINLGRPHVKILSDGWTAVTRDRSLSAQFEHTLGVTETGVEVFTRSPKGLDFPDHAGNPQILPSIIGGT